VKLGIGLNIRHPQQREVKLHPLFMQRELIIV